MALAGVAAMWLPLALWSRRLAFVTNTYGEAHEPFELLGATLSAVALATAGFLLWRRRRAGPLSWRDVAEIGLPLLPVLHAILVLAEYSEKSWDYQCYERAALALAAGRDPYRGCYVYPPLLAQAMAGVFPAMQWLSRELAAPAARPGFLLFYFYQASQALAVALCVWLGVRLARRLGLEPVAASGVAAALFLVDAPLERTLRHNQVNLWVLAPLLLAIDRLARRPWLAGLALAGAGHLKLYPLALVLPWTLARRWRGVAAVGVGFAAVLAIQMAAAPGLWSGFLERAESLPRGQVFRDNGLYALASNTVRVPSRMLGLQPARLAGFAGVAAVALALAVFARRFWRRERAREGGPDAVLAAHTADAIALTLLVSPMVWAHHYVLAIPVAIHAVATGARRHPALVLGGLVLIFGVPVFDVYPFGYNRLAGLILLLVATRPPGATRADPPTRDRTPSASLP